MAIEVTAQDVTNAEDFLVTFMTDKITSGDYSDGAMMRDVAIKALAYLAAYFKKVDSQIRARQSLLSINEVDITDDAEAADDAVDEILSNWFATRKVGEFARVVAYGFAAERVDIDIPAVTKFYKTSSLAYLLDNNGEAYSVAAEELVPQFDSTGAISGYFFRIPLVAEGVGTSYNIEAGNFATFDDFNQYVTQVLTLEKAEGGDDTESTTAFIERSDNLITVRNLINPRSVDAVLEDEFSSIRSITTVGMGELEMIRDRIMEQATALVFHVGGHMDIFIDLPTVETSFSGVIGAKFVRPDNVISIFRDATYADYDPISNPGGHKFTDPDPTTTKTPQAGMVLRVWTGLPDIARDFIIREVRDTEIHVSEKVPFPLATDELSPVTYVEWTIGNLRPDYRDVVGSLAFEANGETSRQVQNEGRITLPGAPLYAIKTVTIDDPSDVDADPSDGLIYLNNRVNTTPAVQLAPENEYQVVVHNYKDHQSAISFAELLTGPVGDLGKYDGKTCKVTYDTLAGFSTVDTFVSKRTQRIASANPLTRAFHPIYLHFVLEYRLKKAATDAVDSTEAVRNLLTYINTFDPSEVIGVSVISDFFHNAYPQVGHVYPFTIEYDVHVPDGRVVPFETTEAVVVPANSEMLTELQLTPDDADYSLNDPLYYGLGDDVMRYLALEADIEVRERV